MEILPVTMYLEQPTTGVIQCGNSYVHSRFYESARKISFVTIHIERATIDQLTRLDTEMEFGDLGEVLEIAEAAEKRHLEGE